MKHTVTFLLQAVLFSEMTMGIIACGATIGAKKLVDFTEDVYPERTTRRVAIDIQKITVITESDATHTSIFWMGPNNQSTDVKLIRTEVIESFPEVLRIVNAGGR
jgi:hypothetical protein